MSGIGGVTYGSTQYASSGATLGRIRLFREILYFRHKPVSKLTTLWQEACSITETYTGKFTDLWLDFIDNISVTHTTLGVQIKKYIVEAIELLEQSKESLVYLFTDFISLSETFTRFRVFVGSYLDSVGIVFSNRLSIAKGWLDTIFGQDSIDEGISGVESVDTIEIDEGIFNKNISKVFKTFLGVLDKIKRKLNGLPIGWSKRVRAVTEWVKGDRQSSTWAKSKRTDV